MKKAKSFVLLMIMAFLLTGCVKFNANIEIKKNKSMDMTVIYAVNSSLLSYMDNDGGLLSDDDKKELEDEGFTIENYSDDTFTGYKLLKNVKNIDDVSAANDINYSISGLLDDYNANDKKMFKVEKGLFKNTYYANIKFDASDSNLDDNDSSSDKDFDINDNNSSVALLENKVDNNFDDGYGLPEMDFSNMAGLAGNMDLSFKVDLPYKAISNNASSVDNDSKTLTWNLSATNASNIEFSFYLYNWNTILALGGIVMATIILVVLLALALSKKSNVKQIEVKISNN
mgnify:FL=1